MEKTEEKNEKEIKLSNKNVQVKYISMDSNESIKRKIMFLCKILDIKLKNQDSAEIDDTYFDNDHFDLLSRNITLRKRLSNGIKEITLKTLVSNNENTFERKEKTMTPCGDLEEAKCIDVLLKSSFTADDFFVSQIKKNVTIHNDRLIFHLQANEQYCELCFDKYYFYSNSDYSEYNYQVELEFEDSNALINEKYLKLIECIQQMFDFKKETQTKYAQAVKWLKNKTPNTRNVSALMIDIVEYSKRNNLNQRNIIQHLNKIVKENLHTIYKFKELESEIEYIPTGDGMIVIIYDTPEKLCNVCKKLQKDIKKHNSNISDNELEYNIRIGVNFGPVFVYSDIKGNLNFAGNGINMVQRITNLGDGGHILFSKGAYDQLIDKEHFRNEGSYFIKHGLEINVFNYFSNELGGFGNPNQPAR